MEKPAVIGLAVVILVAVVVGGYWQYQSRQSNGLTLYDNMDIRTINPSSCVGGRVESPAVDEGDVIKVGQVSGELDHKPHKIALMQVKTDAPMTRAQYDLMLVGCRNEEIAQAAAAVKQVQAIYDHAQDSYNRRQGLRESRTTSVSDLENARSSRNQTQATLESAQDKLRQYRPGNREQDIVQTKASPEQAQAQLVQVESNLQDSMLIILFDGTPLTRVVELGMVLNGGGTVFTVSLTRLVWVCAYVDRHNPDQAQSGCRVSPYIDGRPDKPCYGQIGFVLPTAEFIPRTVETPDLRTSPIYCLHVVMVDADDTLHQGMPVTVQFGNEVGHE